MCEIGEAKSESENTGMAQLRDLRWHANEKENSYNLPTPYVALSEESASSAVTSEATADAQAMASRLSFIVVYSLGGKEYGLPLAYSIELCADRARERETGLALASMRITEISVLLNLLSLL